MGGIANGIAYHGSFHPYCATFLTFSDYMRGSVRLAALAGLPVTYVWTHDSVGLGEDGPTHQPVEQPMALRAIPNLWYVRPGDANEAVAAWALAIERRDGPVALGLTRQKLTTLPETAAAARDGVRRGGYILRESSGGPTGIDLVLVATGSELGLAALARDQLEADGIRTRLVSLPCFEAFERQDEAYRESVLPQGGLEPGHDRGGGDPGLGSLRRPERGDDRDRSLRSIGPWGDRIRALRLQPGTGRRDRPAGRSRALRGRIPTLDPGHQPAGLGLGQGVSTEVGAGRSRGQS